MANTKRRYKESGGGPEKVREVIRENKFWDEVSQRHKRALKEIDNKMKEKYKGSI